MNRLVRPVQFAFEPDVVFVYAAISFGSTGAPTLITNKCKGLCAITRVSRTFTADTSNTSASVTAVSNSVGLFNGMGITGTGVPASTTVSAHSGSAGTLTLSQNATATNTGTTMTIAGGQFRIQFGTTAAQNLDVYNRLLSVSHNWDESGTPGSASTTAATPAAPAMFLIENSISTRTIPVTAAASLTDASIVLQFGTLSAGTFVAADPASGEIVRLAFAFSRSSAQ